jgi:hypothetical protein
VNKFGKDNYSSFEENKYWFWNESLISTAGKKHRGFLTLFETMEKRKESCFMIKLLKQDLQSAPAIVLYKNGQSVHKNYEPPSKLPKPDNVTVSIDNMTFIVKYKMKDNITNVLKIQYSEILKVDNTTKEVHNIKYFQLTKKSLDNLITLDRLNANAMYRIKVSAGSEFGYGPNSEEFTVITNSFTPPTNFRVTSKTHNSLTLAWEKPKYPENSGNSTIDKYQVVVYIKGNHEMYDFPMIVEIKGTNKTIDNLPDTEEYYITIEAQGRPPKGTP